MILGLLLSMGSLATPGTQMSVLASSATITDVNPNVSTSNDADATTGGRVNHIASVPGSNQVFYAASEQGGLFKTVNGGSSWSHLDDHVPQITWDIKVDPANTARVYATSFYDGRVNSISGIEVSTDSGATWNHPATATPPSNAACANQAKSELSAFGIGIIPGATQNVFIGTNCGVARSTDSGLTWTFLNPTSLTQAGLVWAVLAQSGGPSGQGIIDVCGDDGFFSSTDGGASWTSGSGLPLGRCSLAVSPDENYVLFAAASNNHIFESDNGGSNWNDIGTPEPGPQGRVPFVSTNKRSSNFDLWYGDVGLWRGTCTTPSPPASGGSRRCPNGFFAPQPSGTPNPAGWSGSFTRPAGGHDDLGSIVFDPATSTDACPLLFSSDGGAHVSSKKTSPDCQTPQWVRSNVGLHALWTWDMAFNPRATGLSAFFGVQDDGNQFTLDASAAAPVWKNPRCCDVFGVANDPNRLVFTVCCFAPPSPPPPPQKPIPWSITQLRVVDASYAGGETQPGTPGTNPPGAIVGFTSVPDLVQLGDKQYAVLTSPITGSSNDQPGGLFVTNDITASPPVWTQVGAGNSPANACGVRLSISGGTPTFLLQVGGCNGTSVDQAWIHTGTGAANWTRIDNTDGLTGGFTYVNIDPVDPQRLYGANNNPNFGERMFFSNDGGNHWTRDPLLDTMMTDNGIFNYVPQTGPTNFTGFGAYAQPSMVEFDPNNPDILVAGGHDSGVFITADRGNSWGLVDDPVTPGRSGTPHLPQPRFAYFDHTGGPLRAIYIGTQGRGLWRLTGRPTTLKYDGDTTQDYHDQARLAATLKDASTSPPTPVPGARVDFNLGTQACSGITDATGEATCFITLNQPPGSYTVTAKFDGDALRLPSRTQSPFTITKEETSIAYTGDTTADFHDPANMSAVLTEDTTVPLSGRTLKFTLGSQTCSATTDNAGRASCVITPQDKAGVYPLTTQFAGDDLYLPSSRTVNFIITKEETKTTYQGDTVIANNGTAHMKALLQEDGVSPIAGRLITFTLGIGVTAQTCSGTTDNTGTAKCDISPVNQPLGPGVVRADFAGDDFYLPSSDTAPTTVFAFLKSGAFVIGDQEAAVGNQVTFWGAQWSSANPMTSGDGPRSFKGFASHPGTEPPTCASSWTSRPGNSSSPPDSVPAYMGVLVSSTVDKHGSNISGDIVAIVVVKTDPGYGPNPGHEGTGTVVATFC